MNREPDTLDPYWAIGPCYYCGDDAADYDERDRLICHTCYHCAQEREASLDADLRADELEDTL